MRGAIYLHIVCILKFEVLWPIAIKKNWDINLVEPHKKGSHVMQKGTWFCSNACKFYHWQVMIWKRASFLFTYIILLFCLFFLDIFMCVTVRLVRLPGSNSPISIPPDVLRDSRSPGSNPDLICHYFSHSATLLYALNLLTCTYYQLLVTFLNIVVSLILVVINICAFSEIQFWGFVFWMHGWWCFQ